MAREEISKTLLIYGDWLLLSSATITNDRLESAGEFTPENTSLTSHLAQSEGHPGLIPGVIVLEALLQTAALLAVDGRENSLAIVDKCSFRLTSPARIGRFHAIVRHKRATHNLLQIQGRLTCFDRIVCLAEMSFQLRPKRELSLLRES